MSEKGKAASVIRILNNEFPDPQPPLNFASPFEALVAVILSAQCTDERVNKVTPNLFAAAHTPKEMISLGPKKLRELIHSCGYYNQKAKAILAFSQEILDRHNGDVPNTLEELNALSGVGRKTASVVVSQTFGVPSFPVDTHVFRVANRLGLVQETNRDKTDLALRKKIPRDHWISLHLQFIFHGRKTCKSQKPQCWECPLKEICEYKGKTTKPASYLR
jgi:endonuclease III